MKEAVLSLLQHILGFENYLYLFGWYKIRTLHRDRRERDFFTFLSMIPDHGVVLDIGANLGVMTVHLSRHVRRGEVVAFEPVPSNVAILRRFVARYRLANVRVEECALGDREGSVQMVLPVERGARRHGLSHVVHETITERNEGQHFSVPMRRLDDFASLWSGDSKPPVTGIKMDVENFERFVIEGAMETLRVHRPLLYIELWPNENRRRCLELLNGLGYQAFVCEHGRLTPFEPDRHAQQNFIFRGSRPNRDSAPDSATR